MSRFLADLQRILNYPLLRLGESQFTANDIIKLLVLLVAVLLAEYSLRRHFVTRVLKRTRLDPSLQFAVAKIAVTSSSFLGFMSLCRWLASTSLRWRSWPAPLEWASASDSR